MPTDDEPPATDDRLCGGGALYYARENARRMDAQPRSTVLEAKPSSRKRASSKLIGGSRSDEFNPVLANQAIQTLWTRNADDDQVAKQRAAVIGALVGISPRDEFEGMLAAQLIAAHNAAMECYRRAMLPAKQSFEARREALTQANKLSRTHATLLEALNRHRGRGEQKVRVEHVHVHSEVGRQSSAPWRAGVGYQLKMTGNPMRKPLPMHLSARCGAKTRSGRPCRSPAMLQRPMPNARGKSPGAPKGEANGNYRHGLFTRESVECRRELNAWIRATQRWVEEIE